MYKNWELGKTKNINGSNKTLVLKSTHYLRFHIEIPRGVTFPLHWHDCLEECIVLRGKLSSLKNDEIWRKGDVARFPAYTKHHFQNQGSEGCYLQVDFYQGK